MTSLSSMIIWTLTPPQNQTFRWSHSHSCTGWMIGCERYWAVLQKMQQKTAINTQWYGECLCLLHYKHLYSWWRITQTIPSKRQKISQNTTNWEDSSWKHLSLVGDEEVISLLHTKVYVFSASVLCFGKVNENPQSNTAFGGMIDVVQKFTRIQIFGQNWWWADGIRVACEVVRHPLSHTKLTVKTTTIVHVRQWPLAQTRKPRAKELALWRSHHPAWMGSSHGWVLVNTHSTPVRTSVWRLWVAQSTNTTRAQTLSATGVKVRKTKKKRAEKWLKVRRSI